MATKHLKLSSKQVDEHCWWYEVAAGISVVIERRAFKDTEHAVIKTIPWKKIRAAVARKDRK